MNMNASEVLVNIWNDVSAELSAELVKTGANGTG